MLQPIWEKNEGKNVNMVYKSECEGHVLSFFKEFYNPFRRFNSLVALFSAL